MLVSETQAISSFNRVCDSASFLLPQTNSTSLNFHCWNCASGEHHWPLQSTPLVGLPLYSFLKHKLSPTSIESVSLLPFSSHNKRIQQHSTVFFGRNRARVWGLFWWTSLTVAVNIIGWTSSMLVSETQAISICDRVCVSATFLLPQTKEFNSRLNQLPSSPVETVLPVNIINRCSQHHW